MSTSKKPIAKKDTLPPLPRTLKKREANVTPYILSWFRDHHRGSCAIEIKATATGTIPRSALLPHQAEALRRASSADGLVHKISDIGHVRVPFDAFRLASVSAYVVAVFTTTRRAHVYTVDAWQGARADDDTRASFVFCY